MLAIAYIPCGSKEEARRISTALVKEKLAACANIFESSSIYEWKGKLKKTREWVILAKTLDSKFKKLQARVETLHSYEIPCIIKLPADANKAYLEWVEKQVR
jgi:periplasmic divalent cation tolerance protein